MANAVRGEQDVVVLGRTLTLSFSVNTIVELETRFPGEYADDLGRRLMATDRSAGFKRTMIFYALRDHHPDIDERAAGELMLADDGGYALLLAMVKAWGACWPLPTEGASSDADPQPPAGAGTGESSSVSGANSSSGRSKTTGARRRARSPSPSTVP